MGTKGSSEEILKLDQAATYLNVHPSTVYRLLRQHRIPAFKMGSDWRFSRARLDQWIAQLHDETMGDRVPRHLKSAR